jgi:hypothetical protein
MHVRFESAVPLGCEESVMPENEDVANRETKAAEASLKSSRPKAGVPDRTRGKRVVGDPPSKKPIKPKTKPVAEGMRGGAAGDGSGKKTKAKQAPGTKAKEKKPSASKKSVAARNIVELQVPPEIASKARIEIYDLGGKTQLDDGHPDKSGKVTFKVTKPGKYLVKYFVDDVEKRQLEVETTVG